MCEKHFSIAEFSEKNCAKLRSTAFPTLHAPTRKAGDTPSIGRKRNKNSDNSSGHDVSDRSAPPKRIRRKNQTNFTLYNVKRRVTTVPKNFSRVLPDHGYFAQKVVSEDEESEEEILDENQATNRIHSLIEEVEKMKLENFQMSRELKALKEESLSRFVFSSPNSSVTGESDDEDYEFLNKNQCQERIEVLSDKVEQLVMDVLELKRENLRLNASVKHQRNRIKR